jgi:serine phosphatase RsbU (regulator of sigma subunit)
MPSPLPSGRPRLWLLYPIYAAANLVGVAMMGLINFFTPLEIFKSQRPFLREQGWVIGLELFPLVFGIGLFLLSRVKRPIAWAFDPPGTSARIAAARRLLNLPFTMGALNLAMWILVAAGVGAFFWLIRGASPRMAAMIVFRGVMIGLITAALSFLCLEMFTRSRVIPIVFPEGRLAETRRVFRMSIVRRIRLLYGSGTVNPMLLLLGTLGAVAWEARNAGSPAGPLAMEVFVFSLVLCGLFFAVALGLNYAAGRSILDPVRAMMAAVKQIRGGDFAARVATVSNDELGVLADGINAMAAGLAERERLQQSLRLAKEVQQTLLPARPPVVAGLEVAGRCITCDETGGDYFDYLIDPEGASRSLDVIVGDVSGHGVSAALLMAGCRAYLRQRAALGGGPGAIVSDVNRQLARDVADSGNFTLFYLRIDRAGRRAVWVRAGHEPAVIYDPTDDRFAELRGAGPALGALCGWQYVENRREDLRTGQILVIATDGIWEARNPAGEMFGRRRLAAVVRAEHGRSAERIAAACLAALSAFRTGAPAEDDATLIVIKLA